MVKKTIFLFVISALISTFTKAQTADSSARKWQIAASLEPQYTHYNNSSELAGKRFSTTPTYALGYALHLKRFLANDWGISTAVRYCDAAQNYEPNIALTQTTDTYQRRLEYLKIPILVEKTFKTKQNTRFSGGIGVQADILLSAQYLRKATILQTNTFDGTDEKAIYMPFSMSGLAQCGVDFRVDKHLIVLLKAFGTYSFLPVDKLENTYWSSINASIDKTKLPEIARSNTNFIHIGLQIGAAYEW